MHALLDAHTLPLQSFSGITTKVTRNETVPFINEVTPTSSLSPPHVPHENDHTYIDKNLSEYQLKRQQTKKSSSEYQLKRQQNNISVRKSREKSKRRTEETKMRMQELETAHLQMKQEIHHLKHELELLKSIFPLTKSRCCTLKDCQQ